MSPLLYTTKMSLPNLSAQEEEELLRSLNEISTNRANILDEPIPQQLPEPIAPSKNPLKPPRRTRKRQDLRNFDPIRPTNIPEQEKYQNILPYLLGRPVGRQEGVIQGRRFIFWRRNHNLFRKKTNYFMQRIRHRAQTTYYVHHVYSYWLQNVEDGNIILFYKNSGGSPWIERNEAAEEWLAEQEESRLNVDTIERPSTKWVFRGFSDVDVKVVFSQQPLLGTGPLLDWLRSLAHGRAMVALDTFQDNLCLWRCIAVHLGARPDRSTAAAREMAKSFLNTTEDDIPNSLMDDLEAVEKHLNKQKPFSQWIGIRVYEPVDFGETRIIHWRLMSPPPKLANIVTIGVYDGHAFLIKDISKPAKTFVCVDCRAGFTQACSLQRHSQTCSKGETVIDCPGEKVDAPPTNFEKAFFPKQGASPESIWWLERMARKYKIHIHHVLCGHGGERIILRAPVDGYHPPTRTVFQYHGCYWHGCPKCFP